MTDLDAEKIEVVKDVMRLFTKSIHDEGAAQGHDDTGKMLAGLHYEVANVFGATVGTVKTEDYAIWVNAGVAADKVRYPIKVMIEWFKRRGLPETEATSAAWATKKKHQREGIPTRGSFAFSKNGRRVGFVQVGVESAAVAAKLLFEKKMGVVIEIQLEQIFHRELEGQQNYILEF